MTVLTGLTSLRAQDSHYWMYQYGTRSSLLGGAVVGGVRDNSAGFYNPGALAYITNPKLSVSADIYQFDQVKFEDGVGLGTQLLSQQFGVAPLMVSGILYLDKERGKVLGYSFLARQSSTVSATARHEDRLNVIADTRVPGDEDYIGQFNIEIELLEYWGGISYARRLRPNLAIGITNFYSLRLENTETQNVARAIGDLNQVAAFNSSRAIDYQNLRTLFKLGIVWESDHIKLGLTLTSPSVSLFGRHVVSADVTSTNIDRDGDDIPDDFVAADRQEDLSAERRSPLSVAVGAETTRGRLTFSTSMEWYAAVAKYTVIKPKSPSFVVGPAPLDILESNLLRVIEKRNSVTNAAFGIEYAYKKRIRLLGSFRTDFSSHEPKSDLGFSDWDIYHVTFGGTYLGDKSDISLGLTYRFGRSDSFRQPVNFSSPAESGLLLGDRQNTRLSYDAIGIIFGFTQHFD